MLRYLITGGVLLTACQSQKAPVKENALKPAVITQQVGADTDDPAIWINHADTLKSLILGTDKATDGGLYAFDLEGKIVNKVVGLKRPNNVDIAYGLKINGEPTDLAVLTERETNSIRIFKLPELTPIDNGGIVVFAGEAEQSPMGVALYTRPSDSAIFAIVGRKTGPVDQYLWQYRLSDNGKGAIQATVVRKFGKYSGKKEIEAIAVDNKLGYVYYSDETVGVRKYIADPEAKADGELVLFATEGFVSDHEGISIYPTSDSTGYILVSNQQNNTFMVYRREGEVGNPHQHKLLAEVPVSTVESDGSEITAVPLGDKFPKGLFVAMSNGKVFHYYSWEALLAFINSHPYSQAR
jgi:3-phytase